MRSHLLVLVVCALQFSQCASSPTSTYTLAYEPLEVTATPVPLAILTSTPPPIDETPSGTIPKQVVEADLPPVYTLKSYTPPSPKAKNITPLLRIGVLGSNKELIGSTTLTSLEALSLPDTGLLKLVLGQQGEIFSASWHLSPLVGSGEAKSKNTKEKGKPALQVIVQAPEPKPVLNKPVVLNEQGKVSEPEQPKTLLQKYWWVGVAILIMSLAGGGGE